MVRFIVEHLDVEPWVIPDILQWFEYFAWDEELIYGRLPGPNDVYIQGLYSLSKQEEIE